MSFYQKSITLAFMPQWSIVQPPIGIAYLTAFLRKFSYTVVQRDLSIEMFSRLPEHRKRICDDTLHHDDYISIERFNEVLAPDIMPFIEEWAQELAASPSDFIGFTILSSNRICSYLIIDRIKALAPHKVIIVGGPHCTRYEGGFELALHPNIDFVVPDEGEESLLELLEVLVNHGRDEEILRKVKGILFFPTAARALAPTWSTVVVNKSIQVRKDDRIFDSGERDLIRNINDLPFPVYDGFNLSLYKNVCLPILGSRGCIYKCTFCSETVFWKRFRYRTGQDLFMEFSTQNQVHGVSNFYIVDSLINGSIKELEILCDLIIANNLKIRWGGKASIRKEMTKELLVKMRSAGCFELDYGIESGSPKVVRDMKKGFDIPTAVRVLKDSTDAGISVGIFMMVGFPTESDEDYELSKRFIQEIKHSINRVTPGIGFGVQPGSDTYLHPDKYGIVWKDGHWISEHVTPEIIRHRVKDFRQFLSAEGVAYS